MYLGYPNTIFLLAVFVNIYVNAKRREENGSAIPVVVSGSEISLLPFLPGDTRGPQNVVQRNRESLYIVLIQVCVCMVFLYYIKVFLRTS